ncbi:MAG: J domain-containing protein [Acidiferrobacterales bacterium]
MVSPTQHSLFDEVAASSKTVAEVLACSKPADKAQAAFRRMAGKVERQRVLLQTWKDYTVRFHRRLAEELVPLQQKYRQARRQLAFLLADLYDQPNGLRGKIQRTRLRQMLIDLTESLLESAADEELEALHDRYSDTTHAEGLDEDMAFSQSMIEDLLGVSLGDQHGARSVDDLFAKAEEELHEQARQEEARQSRRPNRKAEAAQAKREQAAKEISQSVRDVYRKLASVLHPDREKDAVVRRRKTEQMQRVNQAYEAGDLLDLLNLQLEIEQIDAQHLSSIPQQRLKQYNQALRDQLAKLDAEIDAVLAPFRMGAQLPPFAPLTTEWVDRSLTADIAGLRRDISEAKEDLVRFRDPRVLKQILKDYRSAHTGLDEFADLALLSEVFGPAARTPRAKRRK